jgi:hypothetical protein
MCANSHEDIVYNQKLAVTSNEISDCFLISVWIILEVALPLKLYKEMSPFLDSRPDKFSVLTTPSGMRTFCVFSSGLWLKASSHRGSYVDGGCGRKKAGSKTSFEYYSLLSRGADKSLVFLSSYFSVCSTAKRIFIWRVKEVSCSSRWFTARGFFYPEDGGDRFFRNVGWRKIYTVPHLRRRHSSK